MASVNILKENNIKIPIIMEIALELKIDLNEFTLEELIEKIKQGEGLWKKTIQ